MTGQINVNKIAARSGNTITVNSGDKISGAAGSIVAPGQVIQTVQGLYTSNDTFSGSSFQNSGLQVNITPTSTSSKILINSTCQLGYPGQNYGMTLTFLRGSTNLVSTARPGLAHIGDSTGGNQRVYQMLTLSMQFLDSPSTTSQITYCVGVSMDGGTGYFNRNQNNDAGSKGTSVIIVQEIAG